MFGAVLLARRAVLVTAGPIEQAVVDDQVPRRSDQPDAVARGVDHATVDQRVLPVAARDAVVPRGELAIDDADVAAGLILASSEMHAIPPASALHPAHLDMAGSFQQDPVVGRVVDAHIAKDDVPGVPEEDCVRASHVLLALGIGNLVAVDHARTRDRHVLDSDAQDQGPVPVVALPRPALWRRVALVLIKVRRADEHRPGVEHERDPAA